MNDYLIQRRGIQKLHKTFLEEKKKLFEKGARVECHTETDRLAQSSVPIFRLDFPAD